MKSHNDKANKRKNWVKSLRNLKLRNTTRSGCVLTLTTIL